MLLQNWWHVCVKLSKMEMSRKNIRNEPIWLKIISLGIQFICQGGQQVDQRTLDFQRSLKIHTVCRKAWSQTRRKGNMMWLIQVKTFYVFVSIPAIPVTNHAIGLIRLPVQLIKKNIWNWSKFHAHSPGETNFFASRYWYVVQELLR